ncbi:MAG TPA: hypothetical protein VIL46_00175 [Gemmataceae bacterium]
MAVLIHCPSCGLAQRVREKYAGRKVRCPNCGVGVRVPEPEEVPEAAVASPPAAGLVAFRTADPLSPPARLGVFALGLGLVAVLLLCVPVVGYVSPGVSGVGLLLGLAGLVRSWLDRRRGGRLPSEGVQMPDFFGERTLSFPAAGTAACALALTLALLPLLVP